ncbi:MAG: acetyl-CoA carboxylase carboxyltransferase subunit alpha [Planctomycetes bacterium]|nr:acetyl-CoA carboxylase carboxyltransferase subunit alpha [Planctomycetota bacterium]
MAESYLDFEKPIHELEKRIEELESFSRKSGVSVSEEIARLREESARRRKEIFSNLTPWQRVQLARHPERPEASDYISMICEGFVELHGDRAFGDDRAIVTGLCRIGGIRTMLVAEKKGKTTKERMSCNFGSPHPEGYRKALDKMKLAEKFHLPVVTLVNTPGAYPGVGAEERGQAHVIAKNLLEMSKLRTPIVSIVIGEGGSGGALAICLADRLLMMENSYFSVISPEGCAAILWHDASKAPLAADLLRITPADLYQIGIMDEIVPEPVGGAHRNAKETADGVRLTLVRVLEELTSVPIDRLVEKRYDKYRRIGVFVEAETAKLAPAAAPNG